MPARPWAGARALVGGGAIAAGILLAVLPGTVCGGQHIAVTLAHQDQCGTVAITE